MTVLWFLIGIVLITLIARYNESNKLFWSLLLSFLIGFTAATVIHDNGEKKSKETSTQVCPTQESVLTPITIVDLLAGVMPQITEKETSDPVGQGMPVTEETSTLSDVWGAFLGQTHSLYPNPPNDVTPFDTS